MYYSVSCQIYSILVKVGVRELISCHKLHSSPTSLSIPYRHIKTCLFLITYPNSFLEKKFKINEIV